MEKFRRLTLMVPVSRVRSTPRVRLPLRRLVLRRERRRLRRLLPLVPEHIAVLVAFQQSLREVVGQLELRLQLLLDGLLSRQGHGQLG